MLFSCAPDRSQEKTEYNTNVFLLKKIIKTQQSLDSVVTENVDLKERIEHAKTNNYAMMQHALNDEGSKLNSKYLELKMIDILKEKDAIMIEAKDLRKRNEDLIKENEGLKYTLNSETNNHIATKSDRDEIKKKAGELKIVGLKVIGIAMPFVLFGKPKPVETTQASKVKKVQVSFALPSNSFAKKEAKKVAVVMYASHGAKWDIKKDTTFDYIGEEVKVNNYLTAQEGFNSGDHLISIFINGKLQVDTKFTATK